MTKPPLELSASLDMTEEGNQVIIEIASIDGRALTPQVILDAVADMLTARYGLVAEDWDYPKDGLDS
jgi:hypothetical protein